MKEHRKLPVSIVPIIRTKDLQESPKPLFSIKYQDPRYQGCICAADWDYGCEERTWSRSIGLTNGLLCFEYTPPIPGLDLLAVQRLLERFGLLEWEDEIPVETRVVDLSKECTFIFFRTGIKIVETGMVTILRLSPAQLIAIRREKERFYNLPRLEVTTDNLHLDFEKGKKIKHYAEEYQ